MYRVEVSKSISITSCTNKREVKADKDNRGTRNRQHAPQRTPQEARMSPQE